MIQQKPDGFGAQTTTEQFAVIEPDRQPGVTVLQVEVVQSDLTDRAAVVFDHPAVRVGGETLVAVTDLTFGPPAGLDLDAIHPGGLRVTVVRSPHVDIRPAGRPQHHPCAV